MCFRNQQNLRLKRETCWGSGTTWEDISSLDAPPVSFPLKLRENQPAFAVNRIKFRLTVNATRTNRIKFRLIVKRLWRSLNLASNLFGKELLPVAVRLYLTPRFCLPPTSGEKLSPPNESAKKLRSPCRFLTSGVLKSRQGRYCLPFLTPSQYVQKQNLAGLLRAHNVPPKVKCLSHPVPRPQAQDYPRLFTKAQVLLRLYYRVNKDHSFPRYLYRPR